MVPGKSVEKTIFRIVLGLVLAALVIILDGALHYWADRMLGWEPLPDRTWSFTLLYIQRTMGLLVILPALPFAIIFHKRLKNYLNGRPPKLIHRILAAMVFVGIYLTCFIIGLASLRLFAPEIHIS